MIKGQNLEDVQAINRSNVIKILRKKKISSRKEIAEITGLRQATISNVINYFIKINLVKETGLLESEKGRRSIGIALNSKKYKAVGVRLGRKYFSIGIFDLSGSKYDFQKVSIQECENPREVAKNIKSAINKAIKLIKSTNDIPIGAGISIPGPFIREENRIILMTEQAGWGKINLREEINDDIDIPLYFEQDGNAGVLGEWWFGKNEKFKGILIYLIVGEGVGSGVLIDGDLFRGSAGLAGEFGHITINYHGNKCECGGKGCLESYCSIKALKTELSKINPNLVKNFSFDDFVTSFRNKDKKSEKIVSKIARYLSYGIVNIMHSYNPNLIIIGDDFSKFGSPFLDIINNNIKELVLPEIHQRVNIKLSSLEVDPPVLGSVAVVLQNFFNNIAYQKSKL